jgi:SAM-dependent methyltransferase
MKHPPQVMDALAMEFEEGSFDLVWACESGEHMPDKKKYVEEMTRVLAPGELERGRRAGLELMLNPNKRRLPRAGLEPGASRLAWAQARRQPAGAEQECRWGASAGQPSAPGGRGPRTSPLASGRLVAGTATLLPRRRGPKPTRAPPRPAPPRARGGASQAATW